MQFATPRLGNSPLRPFTSVLAVALTVLPMIAPLSTAHAASFDCDAKELQPDEKTICDTRSLNDADVKMATTFQLISGLLAMGSRGTLQDEQTAWLKTRQACGADAACLKSSYETRLKQLDDAYKKINRPI